MFVTNCDSTRYVKTVKIYMLKFKVTISDMLKVIGVLSIKGKYM